ncbi:hypothetical protein [Ectobacillus panaciterrae]|uniref:hypothetical protein n=1 Tax=Ectobacillus panaciterrae TaxID=363872 RepID=UPI0009D6D397|nr:hypothetical protein [Ectobacillus panaciterrae]
MINPIFTRVVAAPVVTPVIPPVHPAIPKVGLEPFTTSFTSWQQIGSYYPSSAYTHWQYSAHPGYMPSIPKTSYHPYHYHYHFPSIYFKSFHGTFNI